MPVDEQIEQLVASGELAAAATQLEGRGEWLAAAELHEKLWDFAAAARCARAAGDIPRALTNIIRGKDVGSLDAAIDELTAAEPQLVQRCAEICEERNLLAQAGRLRAQLGELATAAELLQRAGLTLEAAAMFEEAGLPRRALDLYRAHLAEDQPQPAALLALGLLLLRFGRQGEALEPLQQARGLPGADGRRAHEAVVAALWRAGYSHAAKVAHELLQRRFADDREPAPSFEQCTADESLAPREADERDKTILAGRYRLGELLGSGGMGRVYLADDLLDERRVAIKVFTAPGGARGRDAYQRFVREAKATGGLRHPHIVELRGFNEDMGFMVLEYMAGGTLADRLRPRLEVPACRAIALQVIAALSAAHQRGIVHRDLKPSNVFFSAAGAAKLGDFGVAHLQDSGQTQTGAFIGTLAYMSPEQITGSPVTFATDIYALGVTLFAMLCGRLPFEPPDLVDKHLHRPPPAPSSFQPGLPAVCDEVVTRCLAKQPTERFQSLEQLRRAVEAFPREASAPAGEAEQRQGDGEGRGRRASDSRFTVEAVRYHHPLLELLDARDDELARAVVLVRIAPGARRAPLVGLLAAAATADEHLQRVLALDPSQGRAVLEQAVAALEEGPPTNHAAAPPPRRLAHCAGLCAAVSSLHAAGAAHGAITAPALFLHGGVLRLSLLPALVALLERLEADRAPTTAAEDLRAIAALLRLEPPPASLTTAHALGRWAEGELARIAAAERDRALREALADAPEGIDRTP